MRKFVFAALVILLVAGLAYADGVTRNRERAVDPIETALDAIGTCEPETDSTDGWPSARLPA